MELSFASWHGLGNDYVIVSSVECAHLSSELLAVAICDRRRGIGADGMLLVSEPTDSPGEFRIFNADGSEAELCGNGLRCAAAMWADRLGIDDLRMTSAVGTHTAHVRAVDTHVWQVEMDLAPVVLEPSCEICVGEETIKVHRAIAGNPHAVVLVDEVSESGRLAVIAAAVRSSIMFDRGVNVHLACRTDHGHVSMWSDERGVGAVEACATGAAAVAVIVSGAQSNAASTWSVRMPGGTLKMTLPSDGGSVHMAGPAERICSGFWNPPANATL